MRETAFDLLIRLKDPDERIREEALRELAHRYQAMFLDPIVIEDLKQRFFFYDTPLDDRFTEARVGSQQVIQFIAKMLSLDTSKGIEQETEGGD